MEQFKTLIAGIVLGALFGFGFKLRREAVLRAEGLEEAAELLDPYAEKASGEMRQNAFYFAQLVRLRAAGILNPPEDPII